jgi:hypothetical protein
MPQTTVASRLKALIAQLHAERAEHVAAIAQIDASFQSLGLKVAAPVRRGRPPKPKSQAASPAPRARRRRRGRFGQTADQFILDTVKAKPGISTADINKAWTAAGRGGKPDNTLTKLTKAKQLKRTKVKGGRGSTYAVA